MESELRKAVDGLSIGLDGGALTEVLRVADLLEAKLTAALGEFDSLKLWELDDRLSLKDWLRVHGRMTDLGAARLARLAQRLRDLPATAAAWQDGTLSSGQVRVVTAPLTDRRRAAFADHEDQLIPRLATLDVTDTGTVMREWREAFDATQTTAAPDEPDRWLHHSRSLGDRGEGHFSLDTASAAIVDAALAVAETPDTADAPRMPSEKRADAFMDICRFYLDHHDRPAKRRHAPHVSLVVTPVQLEDGLAGRTMCGRTIAGPDVATLCCDSVLRRVALADGEVLQLGRTTKAVPAYLAHTVAARDRHCRFPACDRLAKYTDVHHVVPWWNGGSTDITNLVLLCRRHHRRLHTPGWRATLARDATLTITAPHAAAA